MFSVQGNTYTDKKTLISLETDNYERVDYVEQVLMFLCKNSSQRFLISWGRGELLIKWCSAAAKNTRFGQQVYLNYNI